MCTRSRAHARGGAALNGRLRACARGALGRRQIGGGIDFASTALRVNFNDLQPDRVFPRERFYLVASDGRLLLLTLGDDAGGEEPGSAGAQPPLLIEPLHDFQPPLKPGEIVTVCGCGEVIVPPPPSPVSPPFLPCLDATCCALR